MLEKSHSWTERSQERVYFILKTAGHTAVRVQGQGEREEARKGRQCLQWGLRQSALPSARSWFWCHWALASGQSRTYLMLCSFLMTIPETSTFQDVLDRRSSSFKLQKVVSTPAPRFRIWQLHPVFHRNVLISWLTPWTQAKYPLLISGAFLSLDSLTKCGMQGSCQ